MTLEENKEEAKRIACLPQSLHGWYFLGIIRNYPPYEGFVLIKDETGRYTTAKNGMVFDINEDIAKKLESKSKQLPLF